MMRESEDALDVKKILLDGGYVSPEDFAKAEKDAASRHILLLDALFERGVLTNDLWGQAVAEGYGVPYADLHSHQPSPEQVRMIPEDVAHELRCVVFEQGKKGIVVATDHPKNPPLAAGIKKLFPKQSVKIAYAPPDDLDAAFIHYQKNLETRFASILKGRAAVAPELIGEMMEDATAFHASDIHCEPQEEEVVVRFRVDGVLREAGRIPQQAYENVLNRIKVLSRLRIDEHAAAQDGSFRHEARDGSKTDIRVSTVPTLHGEKLAMRLLSRYVQGFALADIGLLAEDEKILNAAAKKPFGMVLVTGPTGSGKTTTLYALIKLLNRPEVNVTTIEDPIEYSIAGINQIQVNPQTNLTFAKGLRSIVRQDPNIILVGEIRDEETAEIAVNAALTGHLLFSTFHANDAATAVPRLLDMGVEPYLLASTLELIVAQRLVRRICQECRVSDAKRPAALANAPAVLSQAFSKQQRFFRGKGCASCNGSGYKGRMAIFELLSVTPEMEELIQRRPSAKDVRALADQQGGRTMFFDGIEKVKQGITTLEEVLRVANPPEAIVPAARVVKKKSV